jgi:GT2 family glycosyltransferase
MKLNCSFIVPVNDADKFQKLEKSLKEFSDYQLIPVLEATSFFDAWEKGLRKAKKKYIVFTHQDTEFIGIPDLDKYFKGKVGMVGTAGTTVIHKDQPWWFSAERFQGNILSGQIFYREKGKNRMNAFGPFGEVVVLDGVCMITTKKILEDVGIPNKDYGTWDFYDHIISLEYIKRGYKLLTIPLVIVHASKGGDKRPSFLDSMDKFRDDYLKGFTWRV